MLAQKKHRHPVAGVRAEELQSDIGLRIDLIDKAQETEHLLVRYDPR